MPKQLLTPKGVQDKQAELYALSDTALLTAAKAICADFRAWMGDNFTLDDDQQAYLNEAPERIIFGWGAQFAAAVAGRNPIDLKKPLPDENRRTKQVTCSGSGSITYKPSRTGNPAEVIFDLQVDVDYILPEE